MNLQSKEIQYLENIEQIRSQMWELSQEALQQNKAVSMEFYELQDRLLKVIRNYRAWCNRHNVEAQRV